ncbi:glutathione S-transferase N-terminal domain-containing protein [Magnetospirillum sp. UT-4]|uniref:glutathione S-transferase N-terminal domain-containing protein n=1 Tax=Magnetospirillum sp. UT-4 TaxID=2681467 RepID=UPI00137CA807|nr:glutathione S-transferase N-terminal domain-containing protein [Magnetospirillum sp. UT-4]CAA7617607.1 putative uncharacterized GST-like protein yibF [Magnetospirillum sp. UT-4]
MKLRFSITSPFVRKCRMVAIEAGIEDKLELAPANAWAADTDLHRDNPLCKVPALVFDDGSTLYDSPVICEYLDSLHSGHKLFPEAGPERWAQLKLQALADGITEAAVQLRIEGNMRPEGARWPTWVERQTNAVNRGLDELERTVGHWDGVFLIGPIAVVASLGYIEFRKIVPDWRQGRPHLARWHATVHNRRSVQETEPKE